MNKIKRNEQKNIEKLSLNKIFWLSILGSLLGVFVEGIICVALKGHWETHVFPMYGIFNILYGMAAVLFYVLIYCMNGKNLLFKSTVLMISATILELLCGMAIKNIVGMRAWDYSNSFLNYDGFICLGFALLWGVLGCLFSLAYPYIDKFLNIFQHKIFKISGAVLCIFMCISIFITGAAIIRWSQRHNNIPAANEFQTKLDDISPDDWISERLLDWKFIED